jgi:hypothetical protein
VTCRRRTIALALLAVLAGGCASTSSRATTPTPAPSARQEVALPAVPDEGLVVDVHGTATFRSLDGRRQVQLPGFHLHDGIITGSRTWLVARDGSTWLIDTTAHRLVRQALGYDALDGRPLLKRLPRVEPRGHWSFALQGPQGRLLAQWSGECEIPTVYVIDRGKSPQLVSPPAQHVNALARGWTRAGLAVVEFPEAACGSGLRGPGLYVETTPRHYRLLVRTLEGAYYRLG